MNFDERMLKLRFIMDIALPCENRGHDLCQEWWK